MGCGIVTIGFHFQIIFIVRTNLQFIEHLYSPQVVAEN